MEKIKAFLRWMRHWFYEVPTAEPPKEEQYKLKATDVAKEWMVVTYHGQRINMQRIQYPMWKLSSRKDKRAMKDKFEKYERDGLIRFETVDGNLICIRNIDYQARVEKAKSAK